MDQMTCSLPKNVTTFHEEKDGIIHFCLCPYKMGVFGTLSLHFDKKKWIFPNLIFQLHPIITPLIMDQMTCSSPKNVSTFHGKEDGIIHFCLSPHKVGILVL